MHVWGIIAYVLGVHEVKSGAVFFERALERLCDSHPNRKGEEGPLWGILFRKVYATDSLLP